MREERLLREIRRPLPGFKDYRLDLTRAILGTTGRARGSGRTCREGRRVVEDHFVAKSTAGIGTASRGLDRHSGRRAGGRLWHLGSTAARMVMSLFGRGVFLISRC